MTTNPKLIEMMYWATDERWFVFNPSWKERYRLTAEAPERARIAYDEWLRYQITHS